MSAHLAWLVAGGVAAPVFFVWFWRRFDIRPLAGTLHEPPPDVPWEEYSGGDGRYRYGHAQSFNPALAEQDARARAGEFDKHGGE
jgi:hypothetical protein